MNELRRRILALLRRGRLDREFEEERRFHLDMNPGITTKRFSPIWTRVAAPQQFGNIALMKERSTGVWGGVSIDGAGQDLRYAVRVLRNNPGFAVVTILSLGNIPNTAIFTVVNA